VSKYAKCSLVQIDISDAEDFLTMEISDNGIGISDQQLRKSDAFGIRGLHERAKTVGGWLDVSTREGVGTSIILSVPLAAVPQHSPEAEFKIKVFFATTMPGPSWHQNTLADATDTGCR
jgi:glucose-6-phosphate-specific signal transduction histidine kinase